MSSYAADLAAIFSGPYDESDPGLPQDQDVKKDDSTSAESARSQATPKTSPTKKAEEHPTTPLLTSTPYVKNPAKEDQTIDGEQSGSNDDYKTTVQHQYESIPEGEGMSKLNRYESRIKALVQIHLCEHLSSCSCELTKMLN